MNNVFEHEGFSLGQTVTDVYSGITGTIDAIVIYAHNAAEYRLQHEGKFESTWVPGGRLKDRGALGLRREDH